MNTLDKVYNLTIDIKNIDVKYNSYAKFFDDDRETSVIRIKLLNDKTPMNLENCIVEAYFILADNTYHNEACKIINSSEGVVELQLCQKCLVKGENIVRLSILKDNEISNTPVITYEVRKGLYSDNPSFNDDPLTPILSQMLLDIKVTKVNQIELQERYEKSLPKIEGKIKEVESLINRVDTVIASGTQDLEVIDARDGETSLKARLDRDLYKDGISLSDRIEAIEGLKDSQNMKYETDKGYLVCKETKSGVIDDLKIEGKTLVNNLKESNLAWSVRNNYCYKDCNLLKPLEVGKTYTYFYFNLPTTISKMYLGDAGGTIPFIPWVSIKNIHSFVATESMGTLNKVTPHFTTDSDDVALTLDEVKNINLVLLEGDHTQNPPSYFEGLMSVGEDVDKIEVLSRKEDGNLFDEKEFVKYINTCDSSAKQFTENNKRVIQFDNVSTHMEPFMRNNFKPNTKYTFSMECKDTEGSVIYLACSYTDGTTGIIGNTSSTTYTTIQGSSDASKTIEYMYISYGLGGGCAVVLDNFLVKQGTSTTYEPLKKDKKQILFYNSNGELEPIQELHEWDSIEKHSDNKWYYHKRSGKRSYQTEDENNSNYITDMTNTVYQLAQEEVYELAPLHLDSYANETLILCNSGAISPKMEFSITSHINELVKAYGERVNLLEEKVYQYMVTQNRMQLASTYSADSVTFKVDYFSLCGDEENYDEDLYNLILNNILVGKDNYNYDKMFTIILDYASWNQISWEQFDILVGLMDMQHNPPVEEFPTEDEIEEDIIEEETPVE